MNDLNDLKTQQNDDYNSHVLSKVIKAGRRTYFLDVKATRGNDYFLTITESRKMTHDDGSASFDRHKIFLYKEDFEKFEEGLSEVIAFIRKANPSTSEFAGTTKEW